MKNILFLLLLSIAISSCEEAATKEQKAEENFKENIGEAKEDLNNAFKNVGEALQSLKEKNHIDDKDPINFREMKKALPERLAGLNLEDSEGQTTGALGFKISTVEATYQEDESQLQVKIIDIAGVGKLMTSTAAWTKLDIDKESKDGYERTTSIDGYKAYEKYDSRREKGQVAMLVEDRFVVDIQGKNVTEKQLKNAMKEIDIRKLKRLID